MSNTGRPENFLETLSRWSAEKRGVDPTTGKPAAAPPTPPPPAAAPAPNVDTTVAPEGKAHPQSEDDEGRGDRAQNLLTKEAVEGPSRARPLMGAGTGAAAGVPSRGYNMPAAGGPAALEQADLEREGAQRVRELHEVEAQREEETGKAYASRMQTAERQYQRYLADQEAERKALDEKQANLEAKTEEYTKSLADKGKFWSNPGNILWAIANIFVAKGNSGQSADQLLNQRIQQDFAERKALADSHLGALKSNLEGYRQIMGDRKAGDLLALGQTYKMAAADAQRIGAQLGGAQQRAIAEVKVAALYSQAAALEAQAYRLAFSEGNVSPGIAKLRKPSTGFVGIGPGGAPLEPGAEPQPGAPQSGGPPGAPVGGGPSVEAPSVPGVVGAAQRQVASKGNAVKEVEVVGDPLMADKDLRRSVGSRQLTTLRESMNQWQDLVDARAASKPVPAAVRAEMALAKSPEEARAVFHQRVIVPARAEQMAVVKANVGKAEEALRPLVRTASALSNAQQELEGLKAAFTVNGRLDVEAVNGALQGNYPVLKNLMPETIQRLRNMGVDVDAADPKKAPMATYFQRVRSAIGLAILEAKKGPVGASMTATEMPAVNSAGLLTDSSLPMVEGALSGTSVAVRGAVNAGMAPLDPFERAWLKAYRGRDLPGLFVQGAGAD